MQTAFQTKIVMLSSGAFWNIDDPAIPQEFSGLIDSVVGLDNLNAIKQQFKSSSNQIGLVMGAVRIPPALAFRKVI